MLRYILRRLLVAAVLLIGVSMVGFGLMYLAPGGPLAVYTLNPTVTAEDLDRIKHAFGLDQPLHVQYLKWAVGMLTFQWGSSFFGGRPVRDIVLERVPATFVLMGSSLLVSAVLGTLVGVLGALRRNTMLDYLSTTGAMAAMSFPTFWFGLMAIYIFAERLRLLPGGGMASIGAGFSLSDRLAHLVLPCVVLSLVLVAQWSQYTRHSMLEVINQDYIRTARAKGLSRRAWLVKHALRNAVIPLIVLAATQAPLLIGGALVTESIFSWPGMGRLFLDSLTTRDYPVVMAVLMVTALLVILSNLAGDVFVALADPRVRFQ